MMMNIIGTISLLLGLMALYGLYDLIRYSSDGFLILEHSIGVLMLFFFSYALFTA